MTQATTAPASLVMERDLAHPVDKVWRALTEGSLLEQWLMPNDFQPVVGHKFTFRGKPSPHWDGIVPCEVLAIEPKTRVLYRWYSWDVEMTLTPTAEGCHLRMEQSPFQPDQVQAYQGAQYGWTGFLGSLEKLLPTI